MKKSVARPSLLRRLLRSAPAETAIALIALVGAVMGIKSYIEYEDGPLAAQITPLVFAFGVWPYVILFAVAIGVGAWAVEKAK